MKRSPDEPREGPLSADAIRNRLVSVVIPARNAEDEIGGVVEAVRAQTTPHASVEVIVVDDGSTDETAAHARAAGARVVSMGDGLDGGNAAAARNRGAAASRGDPIIFLDADCLPAPGWLGGFLPAFDRGETIVGGALDLPAGLSATARCDYYCGWYLVHSRRPAGYVPHHPPPNLGVRRAAFFETSGFTEEQPFSFANEERAWQAELRKQGHRIWFEPRALAYHFNRPGFLNLLRRNYRWAYTAIESKSQTRTARMAWLYRRPALTIAATPALAVAHTGYIAGCWLRAGVLEPLAMLPAIFISRIAYAAGMAVGGARWLLRRRSGSRGIAPRWQ